MTCRDFKHKAASLSLMEVTQTQDAQIVGHTQTCPACGTWLDKQRTLAASMYALRSRTASREAGPDVERALLRVFRQGISAGVGTSPSAVKVAASGMKPAPVGMTEPSKTALTIAAPVSTPFAWRLSRFFEAGAYVAVAAAVVVAIFLGVHLLRQSSGTTAPVQSEVSPAKIAPALQQPVIADASRDSVSGAEQPRAIARRGSLRARTVGAQENDSTVAQAGNDETQNVADAGYTPLMFCDPLSCSGDAQVVRMELPPSPSAQGAAPQIADVVVGYDGVVRAVRLEN